MGKLEGSPLWDWPGEHIWLSPVGPTLEAEIREAVSSEVPALWGRLLRAVSFGSLHQVLEAVGWLSGFRLWVGVLVLHMVWPLSTWLFSLLEVLMALHSRSSLCRGLSALA